MTTSDSIRTVLMLCSRDKGHADFYEYFKQAVFDFTRTGAAWEQLINEAEYQGLSPLLFKHLSETGSDIPETARRQLHSLFLRNGHAHNIRRTAISEIVLAFSQNNINTLLLKGIALANTIYSSPALRPMRDIDLLVPEQDIEKAVFLLKQLGYRQEKCDVISENHHHLHPIKKTVQGLPITVEIHRRLFPPGVTDTNWSFNELWNSRTPVNLDTVPAMMPGLEFSLIYLYLHGLRAPLTYEPFRLIHIADIMSFVESFCEKIDWELTTSIFPDIFNVLSSLHFLTPWEPTVLNRLPIMKTPARPSQIGKPYAGWPHKSFSATPLHDLPLLLKETLWPPQWWTHVYYAHTKKKGYLKARFINHPRTIWQWFKAYHKPDIVV